jgi:hypothetical protein
MAGCLLDNLSRICLGSRGSLAGARDDIVGEGHRVRSGDSQMRFSFSDWCIESPLLPPVLNKTSVIPSASEESPIIIVRLI